MAKGRTHVGTPFNHAGNSPHGVGVAGAARDRGMSSTVLPQYESEKSGYRDIPGSGTPYQSERGNPPDARREVARGTNVEASDHGNQNDPEKPGGVLVPGNPNYGNGYSPAAAPTLDSPVPRAAPVFDTGEIRTEDRAHMGKRNEVTANDRLVEIGGVMSRGMEEGSLPGGEDSELVENKG